MSDSHPLKPRDKFDTERATAAVAAGYPAVAPVLSDLFEWVQDANWPVARVLAPFLASLGDAVVPEIRRVLKGSDDGWKYVVLAHVVGVAPSLVAPLRQELERILESPTSGEQAEEVVEIARALLNR